MIRFHLVGALDLRDSGDRELRAVLRRPKLLALLAYLATARPYGFHRRDVLVALLWPELDHGHARNALSQAVHALRRALGPQAVEARGDEELGLSTERLWCDAREFEAALDAGEAERALELYRGALLTGFHVSEAPEFERWLDEERERLRRRACEAAQRLADREAGAGNLVGEARWAQRLTELSPFDETAVRRLIELLDGMGDQSGAVRAYEEFERRLRRELEVEPSVATRRLVDEIRSRRLPTMVAGAAVQEAAASHAGAVEQDSTARRPPRRLPLAPVRPLVALTAVVAALVMGGWLMFGTPFAAPPARAPKKLVVLPFANLGPAEDAYFADGVTEEITARLAAIGGLRVIGTTSARVYGGKPIAEIGRDLDVDYVLEGSVRWQKSAGDGARVRVAPQLVSTADGTHVWAEVYDEPLDQVFRVQSDIAMRVVQALDVAVGERQRRAVEAAPTSHLQAYDYYLRANEHRHRSNDEPFIRATIRMYQKAVELDPSFALAHAELSRAHAQMHQLHYDRSAERLAQAKRAVDKALELAPALPEVHRALGTYYYVLGPPEYDRALREFAIAEAGRPNDSELFRARAVLLQRQGRLREALVDFDRAWRLDPASSVVASQYGLTYVLLRDYARAEAVYDRAIVLAPDRIFPYFTKSRMYLSWTGRTERARAVLAEAQVVGVADQPLLLYARVVVEIFDRKYVEALELLAKAPAVVEDQNRFIPAAQLSAEIHGFMQHRDVARAYYDSARAFLAPKVQERPDDPRLRSALGIAYAGLGRKEEAIRDGQQAVELLPAATEAIRGYHRAWDLARIYTMVGEFEAAIGELEHLLSIPGYLTPAWLRSDPTWDPLRGHPRFRKLVRRGA
jgi:serine/threonine-protein kinase